VVSGLGYLVLAVVLTWPLAAHVTTSLTYGTEPAPTVGLFNLWTLRWNQDRAGHLFAHYWDAPIFHPTAGTFALSEPQPLTGLVFTPLSWLTGNPVLASNLVLLLVLAANGWAGARLARHLGAASAPARLAGVLAAGMPFVATQLGVFQLTVVFPLLLLVDAVVRWSGSGGRRTAAEIGLWLAVAFLTCGYYGLFAVVGIGLPALVLVRRSWLTRDGLVDLAVAAGVLAVLALPVVLEQARLTSGYTRSDELIREQSALSADFWHLPPQAHGAGVLPWVSGEAGGEYLYPGTALLGLGIVGFVVGLRQVRPVADRTDTDAEPDADPPEPEPEPEPDAGAGIDWRGRLMFLAGGVALSRLLALGLNLSLGGWSPYSVLQNLVPGFQSLRSPFRFAVLTEVFLVALAALALDALWRWRPTRSVPWGAIAAVVLVTGGVLEVGIMPVDLFSVDRHTPDWAAWLDDHPDGPVAFLPFPATNEVASYAPTTRHMLQLLDVGDPTPNGYSGLFPPTYDVLEEAMRLYPNDQADNLLHVAGVRYLVASDTWLAHDPTRRPWLEARYTLAFTGHDVTVYKADR
jgi:hypothetical protein